MKLEEGTSLRGSAPGEAKEGPPFKRQSRPLIFGVRAPKCSTSVMSVRGA